MIALIGVRLVQFSYAGDGYIINIVGAIDRHGRHDALINIIRTIIVHKVSTRRVKEYQTYHTKEYDEGEVRRPR